MKRSIILFSAGMLLFVCTSIYAGTCIITGQGLVSAYNIAKRNGYNFWQGKALGHFYARPGRIGFKGETIGKTLTRIRVAFFDGPALKNRWRLTRVGFGSQGRSVLVALKMKGGKSPKFVLISRYGRGLEFDVYVTRLEFRHPSSSCRNDPVSQQLALQKMFRSR